MALFGIKRGMDLASKGLSGRVSCFGVNSASLEEVNNDAAPVNTFFTIHWP